MAFVSPSGAPRCAVVDLGSNSVRLVVYEGRVRNPLAIFNEKAVLRLGKGLTATGRLNQEGVEQALTVLGRYRAITQAMGADPFEILATAAVRDARNGREFVQAVEQRLPGVAVRVLSGAEEAEYSSLGVLCGIPSAEGILADIGGGSVEVVRLTPHGILASQTLKLGVIRLGERAGGDPARARDLAEAELSAIPWLADGEGRDLYLVGGAWRALARVHMTQVGYPLQMVHQYTVGREEARELARMISSTGRRALERIHGISRKRLDDLPFAGAVLRAVLKAAGCNRVVFSASGLREGWYMRQVPEPIRHQDPLMASSQHYASWLGRDANFPRPLFDWTTLLFPNEAATARRLREAACWMSDLGSHDHPEFRAEQAFLRVLRAPGVGLDHHARAFLALAIALRYEAEPDAPFLRPARLLLDLAAAHRAEVLGFALRLAYTLSGGTPDILAGTRLEIRNGHLVLQLDPTRGVFAGESVSRRLDRLAHSVGREAVIQQLGA